MTDEHLIVESDHWEITSHPLETGYRLKYKTGINNRVSDVIYCVVELEELRLLLETMNSKV